MTGGRSALGAVARPFLLNYVNLTRVSRFAAIFSWCVTFYNIEKNKMFIACFTIGDKGDFAVIEYYIFLHYFLYSWRAIFRLYNTSDPSVMFIKIKNT